MASSELRDLKVRYLGQGRAQAQCPAHDDRNPSLTVTETANGDVLLHDHAGCANEDIVAAIELTMADLFADNGNRHQDEDAVYPYLDEHGKPLFEVVRFPGKRFAQRLPDGSWGLNGARRVLYRLPRVLDAVRKGETVYVAEGEKDVAALERAGVVATTNPGGAGKWRKEYSEALRGAKVTVIADRDDLGREHARQVAQALEAVATKVRAVEPAEGKDVSDHLAAGRALDALEFLSSHQRSACDKENVGLPFTRMGDVTANAPPRAELGLGRLRRTRGGQLDRRAPQGREIDSDFRADLGGPPRPAVCWAQDPRPGGPDADGGKSRHPRREGPAPSVSRTIRASTSCCAGRPRQAGPTWSRGRKPMRRPIGST